MDSCSQMNLTQIWKKKKKKEMYLKMHHDEVPDHGEPLTHDKGPTAEDSLIWILKK